MPADNLPGMNDAEAYFKLYGWLVMTVPYYFDHFSMTEFGSPQRGMVVVR